MGIKSKSGFTLTELMVVAAILWLLLSLGLPAVQRVRETSRNVQCSNQLRMIGLAILNYESVYQAFPSNFLGIVNGRFVNDHSAYTRIAPFLDSVDDAVDFSSRRFAISRRKELQSPPSGLLCPTDAMPQVGSAFGASYRFNMGTVVRAVASDGSGAFEAGRFLRRRDFSDGLSNVAGLSERPIGFENEQDLWRNSVNIPDAAAETLRFDPLRWRDACSRLTAVHWGLDYTLGRRWNDGAALFYNHVRVPNASQTDCGVGPGHMPRRGILSARSYHPGTVNCLYMDGRVSRTASSIDERLWMAVGTRSGREIVDESS